jgi:hypothetical protein
MTDRDTADPEIIQTGDTAGGAFAEVALHRRGEDGRFRFGVSAAGRALVARVLDSRPFGAAPGAPYRYFYAGQGGHGMPLVHLLYVRVERAGEERTLEFDAPADLVAALEWFRQLPSLGGAEHLRAPA